ncbi:Positive regulator of CheA protein activity (CheW) [hydrothermal vent metagenome]|uniref:Positive regulator of CheA protein activity (CheW) n=1 Tax=hydrothermal vent metagenome TaxID=652676 RepID=A0A3B0Z9J6_9ZZZZ
MSTAEKMEFKDEQAEEEQYLTFYLGSEMFALGILNIKEILQYGQLTTVPMMPVFIKGVINLRGSVVPVVDLATRFSGQSNEITKKTCIVIIEVTTEEGKQDVGVVMDSVSEVLEVPVSDIEPPPVFGAKIRVDFIQGMAKIGDNVVIILNADKVLSVEEIAMVSQNELVKNKDENT